MENRLMKKTCLVISLLVLYPIFSALVALAQETAGPLMVMKERSFDFKEVREGEVLKHAFKIQNKGDQTLEIIKVQPG